MAIIVVLTPSELLFFQLGKELGNPKRSLKPKRDNP